MAGLFSDSDKEVKKPRRPGEKERCFQILGEIPYPGNTCKLFACKEKDTDRQYLLKKATIGTRADTDHANACQLRHVNIVQYETAWHTPNDIMYLLWEPVSWCLSVLLEEMDLQTPCGQLYPLWLFHIASGLEYLHEGNNGRQPILHRNLNASSIFVTSNCVLKLFDFGDAKRLEAKNSTTRTVKGNPDFHSPEIRRGEEYRTPTDIWSLGVTAAQIAHYRGFEKLRRKQTETVIGIVEAKGHQKEVVDLIAATLRENAATRPSAAKFVSHLRCLLGEDVLTPPEPELYPSPMKMSSRMAKRDIHRRPLLTSRDHVQQVQGSSSLAQTLALIYDNRHKEEEGLNTPRHSSIHRERRRSKCSKAPDEPESSSPEGGALRQPCSHRSQNSLSSESTSSLTIENCETLRLRVNTPLQDTTSVRQTHQRVSDSSERASSRRRRLVSSETQTTDSLLGQPKTLIPNRNKQTQREQCSSPLSTSTDSSNGIRKEQGEADSPSVRYLRPTDNSFLASLTTNLI
ncbi:hypothetical protein C0Q70_14864 [Pomacea canaliculata]|uniref:non-specific serine/threonine protein kinase n=1 Tax=Pomacea canaliculata TaxID=400727 RepID=A0A2T7NT90_POMCA|nr:hypothetical protein C0Q70_14864 [Pomacea canaliculata]